MSGLLSLTQEQFIQQFLAGGGIHPENVTDTGLRGDLERLRTDGDPNLALQSDEELRRAWTYLDNFDNDGNGGTVALRGRVRWRYREMVKSNLTVESARVAPYTSVLQFNVEDACEKHWDRHKANCSGFVEAVAREFGIALAPNADNQVGLIQAAPWTVIVAGDTAAGVQAKQKAEEGYLVIGGMTSTALGDAHGHVVVVVPGPLAHEK